MELNTLKKPVFLMNGIFEVHQDGTIYRHSKKADNYANRWIHLETEDINA